MSTKIHSTALIEKGAEIADGVEIGPYCVIGPNVKIGPGTKLQSHVVVSGHTTMGKENTVFSFSTLGAVPQDLKYKGEPTELVIGDHNTIRECVTLNLGTVSGGGKTVIGNHNLIMAYAHLGHDCIVGNHCIIANAVNMAGHVSIDDYANVGGVVGISQYVRVGKHAYISGFTPVDRDVLPYSILLGARICEIKGANIVGLRRRGLDSSLISIINESIKLWKRPDVSKEQCLLEIESQYGEYKEVQQLVEFIRKSENGCLK